MNTLLYTQVTGGQVDGVMLLMVVLVVIVFLLAWAANRISILRIRRNSERISDVSTIMHNTLSRNNNYVLQLSIQQRFATNLHGDFLPEEGMSFEESLNYIHPDDRQQFYDFVTKLARGAKTAECSFRWNYGQTGRTKWRYMRDQGVAEYAGPQQKTPTNIFCTLTDETELAEEEKRQLELADRYRKIFEQSIVGLAFYDKDGHLLNVNQKMREILRFQSEDDPYYYDNTIYDMPTFRDVLHSRSPEELYFCAKSVIVERGVNCYTEMRVHPIRDEQGQLVYITFSIRDVTQERELYLQNKRNDENMRRQNEEIQQYENELQYLMDECDMRYWRTDFKKRIITFYKGLTVPEKQFTFDEYQTYFVDDDGTIARNFANPELYFQEPVAYLCHMKAIYHESDKLHWNMLDNVPYHGEDGTLLGCYGVIRDVTPLVEKQELLKQETERANDSGRMKSVFMANMTHEIRTPLNSIVGFSDVLPMLQTNEEKQEIIRVIMNNCDMLLRLINDILAVSTFDSSGIIIEPKEADFATAFDDICKSLAERVQTPGVEFLTESPYQSLIVTLDIGRIQQVVTNFVTNAVKYTQQGHIKVGYRLRDNGLYLYCEDTGSGIPAEAQQRVFERFVKLNDYVQGTGLGLSICKAIAEQCKGKIGVDSEGEGKGSTFWMWIPVEVTDCQEKA